jgi:hypothetical protein
LILIRLGLLSSLIYILLCCLFHVSIIVLGAMAGPIGIRHDPVRLGIIFGLIWLLSFSLSWRFLRLGQ